MELSAQVSSHESAVEASNSLIKLVVTVIFAASVASALGAAMSSPDTIVQIMELGML